MLECIRLKREDFEIDKIPEYFLAHDEYTLINTLALAYKELEGLPKAIDIWQKLKANYERDYSINPYNNLFTGI